MVVLIFNLCLQCCFLFSELKDLTQLEKDALMFEMLEELSSKVDHLGRNQQSMIKILTPGDAPPDFPDGLPSLPLRSEEAFNRFNDFLADRAAFTSTVRPDLDNL